MDILKNLTILYAEDDPAISESMKRTLEVFSSHVITVSNGEEALEVFCSSPIDIIILDVRMPKKNGLELIQDIRQINTHIPVIMVSSYSDIEPVLESIKWHVTGFLIKPFNLNELRETLIRAVNMIHNPHSIIIGDNVSYESQRKQLQKDHELIPLTKSEVIILEYFLAHRNVLVTYDCLFDALNNPDMTIHALRNVVLRLRKKLGKTVISNISELGYIFK